MAPMLDLESLKLFVQAAEAGSLSAAAARANMALAAVSRRIALLESYYGAPLFVRTGRGVTMTPAGSALLLRARELIRLEAVARADLSDFAKGLRGTITLMATPSAITQLLPRDLAAFALACPDLRVDLQEAYTGEIVAAIRDGSAEVGVVIGGPNLTDLSLTPYREDRLVVVAPRDFAPGVERVRLLDLVAHDFVLMEDSTSINRTLATVAAEAGVALRLRIKVRSFDAVCRMVEAGFGLGIQPHTAARHFESAMDVRVIELEDDWAARKMFVCTSRPIGISAAAKRLVAYLGERAAGG